MTRLSSLRIGDARPTISAALLAWLCLVGCSPPSPSVPETLEMIASYERRTPTMEVSLTEESRTSPEHATISTTCVLEFRRDPIAFRATEHGEGDDYIYEGDGSDFTLTAGRVDDPSRDATDRVVIWGLLADPRAISRFQVVDVGRSSERRERRVLRLTSRSGVSVALEVSEAAEDRGAILDIRIDRADGGWLHTVVDRARSSSWAPGSTTGPEAPADEP